MTTKVSEERPEDRCCVNTDRELWRERANDYYADSIHVTEDGGIGINCGGYVIVQPVRKWHEQFRELQEKRALMRECEAMLEAWISLSAWSRWPDLRVATDALLARVRGET